MTSSLLDQSLLRAQEVFGTVSWGIYHNTMTESVLDGRQLDLDQIDHHSSQAFKLKQSRCPLAQALSIFAMMNSSHLSFF